MMYIAGTILLAAAAAYGVCWRAAGYLLSPPMSPLEHFPEHYDLPYENISFSTRDGLKLRGWFLPSPGGDKRTILMCHGMSDNKGLLLRQTHFLNKTGGFNLFYFDFRSHGESEGTITTSGGLETIDFDAAMAWLRESKPELMGSVGAFGLSMGATVTVVSDYRTVIARWFWNNVRVPYYPLVALTIRIVRSRVNASEIELFNPVASAALISPRPLLVIGGELDLLMPPEDVKLIYRAAGEPKQLWMVPEASHTMCREAAGPEYDARLLDFFSRNLS